MHNKLLIVQNITHESPGILEDLLNEYDIASDRFDLSSGTSLPDPTAYAGMVVLGGPQSANDTSAPVLHELAVIGKALDAGVPYLGICLGLQLLVSAAGGQVVRCQKKEIGFREPDGEPFMVELTAEGKQDRLFKGMPERLRVFQLHGETVILTNGITLLATGRGCTNQIVRVGENAWGLQCHFEMTPAMFNSWLDLDSDLITMSKTELLDEFDSFVDEYTTAGREILLNFLAFTGLINH
ncbi:MAG: type 1 glutamine amidotransferase [Chlorobiaceae bacterium]|nr:type 1 glutamine amidotransferase [Chlorobiaceae bacterium]